MECIYNILKGGSVDDTSVNNTECEFVYQKDFGFYYGFRFIITLKKI